MGGDVHHPVHTEFVGAHAERVAPRGFFEWHGNSAAGRKILEITAERGLVIAAQRQADIVAWFVLHANGRVGRHEGDAVITFELGVHH